MVTSSNQTEPKPAPNSTRPWPIRLLVPLFLTSGATSLVYETLWERQLHLLVGTSQIAVTVVLTSFMAGLALGGFLAARNAHKVRNPLLTYALLEGVIGIYAMVFPHILAMLQPVYLSIWTEFQPSPLTFSVFQFLLTGFFVLPPTICMGATLPILSRFAAQSANDTGAHVGRLYGANTIGAVIGVGLAGFFLLPQLGLMATTRLTAAANLALCLVAGAMGLGHARTTKNHVGDDASPDPGNAVDTPEPHDRRRWHKLLFGIAALTGFGSLAMEVSWFRLLALIFGASAYAFSLMLLAFLVGIGSGGWFGGTLADRTWNRGGRGAVLAMIYKIQVGIAALVYASMYLYMALPGAFVLLYEWVDGAQHHDRLWLANLGLAMLLMLPAAFLMGVMFPLLVKGATDGKDDVGGPVGRIYGWNTVGAIAGASLGGLFLLPLIGVRWTILVAISIHLVAALLAARGQRFLEPDTPDRYPRRRGILVGCLITMHLAATVDIESVGGDQSREFPYWDPLLVTAGTYKYADYIPESQRNIRDVWNAVWSLSTNDLDLLFYDEGLSSVVTVATDTVDGNIWLANNGKIDASTISDMPTQVLVGHIPFVFRPLAEDILVIGLASGVTAGAVTTHCAPDSSGRCRVGRNSIEIVEIEPAIEEASHYFDEHNNRPLEDPRVEFFVEDGRNHVLRQPDGRYDIVVSEPPNPWISGVANLFTREFFALGKRKLSEGGVWAQWVQMYGMDTYDLRSLLRTFADTYAHVLLFTTMEDSDLVLLGSDSPLDLSVDAVREMMELDPAVQADLERIEIPEAEDLLVRYVLDRDRITRFAGNAEFNTDDNMRIEYSAPRNLYRQTIADNYEALLAENIRDQWIPTDIVTDIDQRIYLAGAIIRHGWDLQQASQVLDEVDIQAGSNGSTQLAEEQASFPTLDPRAYAIRRILLGLRGKRRLTWDPPTYESDVIDLQSEFRWLRDLKLQMAIIEGIQHQSCSLSYTSEESTENSERSASYLGLMADALGEIVSSESDWPGDERQRERANALLAQVTAEQIYRREFRGASPLCIVFQ